MGALNLKLRRQMQTELKMLQRELGITFVFVTHDQEEAMTMASHIAVMDEGHILQIGRPEDIYERPANRSVSAFIGETNFLQAHILQRGKDRLTVTVADAEILVLQARANITADHTVTRLPHHISDVSYEGQRRIDRI